MASRPQPSSAVLSLPPQPDPEAWIQAGVSVQEMEERLIRKTLVEVNDNRTQAAKLLGISVRTLRNKLKQYRETAQTGQTEQSAQIGQTGLNQHVGATQ